MKVTSLQSGSRWSIAIAKGHGKPRCDDRAAVFERAGFLLGALADGATGVGFGGEAAGFFIDAMAGIEPAGLFDGRFEFLERFAEVDCRILESGLDGDTCAVAVAVAPSGEVIGCSAGDSSAWLLPASGEPTLCNAYQASRPRLGTGRSRPQRFSARLGQGRILVGSDGLFASGRLEAIFEAARSLDPASAAAGVLAVTGSRHDDASALVIG
jgi:hypothetical protein